MSYETTILTKAVHTVCFHYFNCMQECGKMDISMAKLAMLSGYHDAAVDDEIDAILKGEDK